MEYTQKNVHGANMLIGEMEGSVLTFLIKLGGVKKILELGTYTGYSALTMAEAVPSDGKIFTMWKFRSMRTDAENTTGAIWCVENDPRRTPIGKFLRTSSLDELPQLWNVFVGDMSLVGPRPNLFNQEELIHERDSRGVYSVRPGITGLAQINKIDMSTPQRLAETDAKMIQELNTLGYFKYIFLTVFGKGFGDRIKK
jgi:lipopolysaccharide/colanic/teichoic acid biosynthesis glycosyltransferase